MSNSNKSQTVKTNMDRTDIQYVIELLRDALRDQDWENIIEAREFLKEYLDDDGGPIELEE